MTKLYYSTLILLTTFFLTSCDKEDPHLHSDADYGYHAHIHPIGSDHVHLDDALEIDITFESHTGQAIHHINVQVYHKTNGTIIYDQPNPAHIHETDGVYDYKDELILSMENGVESSGTWIISATVWGPEADDGKVREELEFEVK